MNLQIIHMTRFFHKPSNFKGISLYGNIMEPAFVAVTYSKRLPLPTAGTAVYFCSKRMPRTMKSPQKSTKNGYFNHQLMKHHMCDHHWSPYIDHRSTIYWSTTICLCMYIYIYIYVYVCMYVCMYAYMYVCMHVCIHVCKCIYIYICAYYIYICTIYICINIYIILLYICM